MQAQVLQHASMVSRMKCQRQPTSSPIQRHSTGLKVGLILQMPIRNI